MEDYTKYKLKNTEKLRSLLVDKNNLFIIICNKCFKEFSLDDEPECGEFVRLVLEEGKSIAGCEFVDFLCNKPMTSKIADKVLQTNAENVFVVACAQRGISFKIS